MRKRQIKTKYLLRRIMLICVAAALVVAAAAFVSSFFKQRERAGDFNETERKTVAAKKYDETYSKFTVCIDPGHGYADTGASIPDGFGPSYTEKQLTVIYAALLRDRLTDYGFNVVMTRDERSESDKGDGRSSLSLDDRVDISKAFESDIFISLHFDTYENDSSIRGTRIYTFDSKKEDNSLRLSLSGSLKRAIDSSCGIDSAETAIAGADAYYLTRKPCGTSALVELAFLTNSEDVKLSLDKAFQNKMAEGIALGICEFARNNKKP